MIKRCQDLLHDRGYVFAYGSSRSKQHAIKGDDATSGADGCVVKPKMANKVTTSMLASDLALAKEKLKNLKSRQEINTKKKDKLILDEKYQEAEVGQCKLECSTLT